MAAPIHITCMGLPRVFGPGDHEIRLRVRKHLALLVYLAVEHRTRHRRERLVELFWPEVRESAGRQSLATALSMFRSKLGSGVVEGDRDYVRLAAGQVRLDLDRLEAGEIAGDEFTPVLEIAGFLEGFELPGLAEFHHWRDQQQARLLPAIHRGLLVLTDFARRTGDLGRLGRYADQLLAINELSEDGIRARMETSALSGDRITALRIFEEWAGRLGSELGASPSAELERMAVRLRRRGWERPADSNIPTVLTEHWQDRDFVGRAGEYRILYDCWERIRGGETGHVVILGGPGVGKTTLADRFVLAAALEGATTARAGCFEIERGIPYATIGMLIEVLLDRPGASATDPLALAELGRMVPAVLRRYQGLPPVPDTQGETARVRFADAALEFFRALMAEHPLVLEIDDFQQADDASLAVLHMAMRRIRDLPLMVVLTSRPELPDHAASANRIRGGAGHLGIRQLHLEPMPPEESSALLDALLRRSSASLTNTERRALLRAAGGYPLALELLLHNWEQHREQSAALAMDAMTVEVARDPEETFRQLAEANLAGLPPTAMMVLQVAAILDRRLNELDMYGLVDLSPSQAMANLAALTRFRALRDTGGALEFGHPAIRAHAYLAMPASLRRLLHSSVATRLLARDPASEKVPGLEIAWHCIRAGRVEEARPYLLSGAREAMHAGAPQEAELALTSGMHLLEGVVKESAKVLLAEVLQELGRWKDSLVVLSEARQTTHSPQTHRVSVLESYARHRLGLLDSSESAAVITSLLGLIQASDQSISDRILAASVAGVFCERRRDAIEIRAVLEASLPLQFQQAEGADDALLHLTLGRLFAHQKVKDLPTKHLALALSAASSANMRNGLIARINLGYSASLIAGGDYEGGLEYAHRAYDLATRIDNTSLTGSAIANIALCYGRLGDYRAQALWASKVLEPIGADFEAETTLSNLVHLAFSSAMTGDIHVAQVALDRLGRFVRDAHPPWMRQRALLASADSMLILGEHRRAIAYALEAIGKPPALTNLSMAGSYARWLAILWLREPEPQNRDELQTLANYLESLDRLDQLEVILALFRVGLGGSEMVDRMRALLSILPAPIEYQLSVLRPREERDFPLMPGQ